MAIPWEQLWSAECKQQGQSWPERRRAGTALCFWTGVHKISVCQCKELDPEMHFLLAVIGQEFALARDEDRKKAKENKLSVFLGFEGGG